MTWVIGFLAVVVSLAVAKFLRVPTLARSALTTARVAALEVRDPARDERGRERAARSRALQLLRLGVWITVAVVVSLAVPLGGLAVLDHAGFVDLPSVLACLGSWPFLSALAAICLGSALLRRRRPA